MVRVLGRDDLVDRGSNVADALSQVPSISMGQNVRGETLLTLRGFDQRRIEVSLDGIPLLLPFDGRLDLGKVPTGLLGRVRVVEGPAGLDVGPTGMGGAVVLSSPDSSRAPRLAVDGSGTEGGWALRTVSSWSAGGWSAVGAADLLRLRHWRLPRSFVPSRNEDGGRRQNSDRTSGSVGGTLRWRPAAGHEFRLLGFGLVGSFGVPPGTSTFNPRYWRFSDYRIGMIGLSHRFHRGRYGTETTLYWSRYDNRLDSFDDGRYLARQTDRAFHSLYRDQSVGGRFSGQVALPIFWHLDRLWGRVLVDLRDDQHRQTNEGVAGPVESRFLARTAAEVTAEKGAHKVTLQAEVRCESVAGSSRAATWIVEPFLQYQWRLASAVIHVEVGRRSRFASLRERFSQAFGQITANPDLKPESAWMMQAGGRVALFGWLILSGGLYGAIVEDLIELRPVGDGTTEQENVGRMAMTGAQFGVSVLFAHWLSVSTGYQFLYGRFLKDDPTGQRPSGLPPHRATLDFTVRPWSKVELRTWLVVQSQTPALDQDLGAMRTIGAYVVWNIRLAVRPLAWLEVYGTVLNVTDGMYESSPGYPSAGLSIWAGLKLTVR